MAELRASDLALLVKLEEDPGMEISSQRLRDLSVKIRQSGSEELINRLNAVEQQRQMHSLLLDVAKSYPSAASLRTTLREPERIKFNPFHPVLQAAVLLVVMIPVTVIIRQSSDSAVSQTREVSSDTASDRAAAPRGEAKARLPEDKKLPAKDASRTLIAAVRPEVSSAREAEKLPDLGSGEASPVMNKRTAGIPDPDTSAAEDSYAAETAAPSEALHASAKSADSGTPPAAAVSDDASLWKLCESRPQQVSACQELSRRIAKSKNQKDQKRLNRVYKGNSK